MQNGLREEATDYGKLDTIAIHGARGPTTNGAASLPVHNSVTYGYSGKKKDAQWLYTRPADTPNHAVSITLHHILIGLPAFPWPRTESCSM